MENFTTTKVIFDSYLFLIISTLIIHSIKCQINFPIKLESDDDTFFPTESKENSQNKNEEDPNFETIRLQVVQFPQQKFIHLKGHKRVIKNSLKNQDIQMIEFIGIPFAKQKRFQKPTMFILDQDFNSTQKQNSKCPQIIQQTSISESYVGIEDCLLLNLYLPSSVSKIKDKEKLPVLVMFHGESFESIKNKKLNILSSGDSKDMSPDIFLSKDIIVITPQYRLGSLGFLNTGNDNSNGNIALYDQILVLEWIQLFINQFGGDAQLVTVLGFGQSASTVGLLSTSTLAKGLFHRIILMGGSPLSPLAIDSYQENTYEDLIYQNECHLDLSGGHFSYAQCMKNRRVEDIIQGEYKLNKGKNLAKWIIPRPVIQKQNSFDSQILQNLPSEAFHRGEFLKIPLLIGLTKNEMHGYLSSISGKTPYEISKDILASEESLKLFIANILRISEQSNNAELIVFEYFSGLNITERQEHAIDIIEDFFSDYLYNIPAISLAKYWSRFAPVYFYLFDYIPNTKKQFNTDNESNSIQNFRAAHGHDLEFLLNGYNGTQEDQEIHRIMIEFWANFIKNGNPGASNSTTLIWPEYIEDEGKFILFDDRIEISKGFRKRQDYLWNNLIKELNKKSCGSFNVFTERNSQVLDSPSDNSNKRQQQKNKYIPNPIVFNDERDFIGNLKQI